VVVQPPHGKLRVLARALSATVRWFQHAVAPRSRTVAVDSLVFARAPACPIEVQHEISTRLTHVDLPLVHVLEALLLLSVAPFVDQAEQQGVELPTLLRQALVMFVDRASRAHPSADSPHNPEDCARVVLDHCPPAVQARMADTVARTGAPLMRLLPGILHVWTDARRHIVLPVKTRGSGPESTANL
jgi:hypothetical protein